MSATKSHLPGGGALRRAGSEERAAQRLVGRGLAGFLKKPFLPSALLAKLRDALEA